MLDNYLIYRDTFVSCFFDEEKLLTIYVNDKGKTEVLSVDSNFYSIEDDIIAYRKMLFDSLEQNGQIREKDQQDFNECLKAFVDDIKKANNETELNLEYLRFNGVEL